MCVCVNYNIQPICYIYDAEMRLVKTACMWNIVDESKDTHTRKTQSLYYRRQTAVGFVSYLCSSPRLYTEAKWGISRVHQC